MKFRSVPHSVHSRQYSIHIVHNYLIQRNLYWKFAREKQSDITIIMKTIYKIGIAVSAWVFIGLVTIPPIVTSCSSDNDKIVERATESGLLLGDDLVAIKSSDGKVSIKNTATGKVTIKDIRLDWTTSSPNDSLSVYCTEGKRGYYNAYTGEIAIPAQYRRAWVFSEGIAAVQKNGMIGFVDHKGRTVIDFKFPYHGNPLSEFTFKHGHCVAADTTGKCGVINKQGEWIIKPEYDNVSAYEEYAIVSKAGVRMQVGYDGKVLNSFVLDDIDRLTYTVQERYENREGEIEYLDKEIDTGLFSYRVGGRCGLMDANCHRLTEPLYKSITAVDKNMFRATLIDYYSEVILNAQGEVMK